PAAKFSAVECVFYLEVVAKYIFVIRNSKLSFSPASCKTFLQITYFSAHLCSSRSR
ncbi:unnamed protein product, partial [Amoebophrya sp. A120]